MQQLPGEDPLPLNFTQINTFENLTILEKKVGAMFIKNFHANICKPEIEWLQKKNGAADWESLDAEIFFHRINDLATDEHVLRVNATDPSARGTYELGYTVTIPNESVPPATFTSNVIFEIFDYCSSTEAIIEVAAFVDPPKFYFRGNLFEPVFNASAIFSGNTTYCPFTFTCERYDSETNDLISCNFDDGLNTQVVFDESQGTLSFYSTDRDNAGYPSG